MNGMPEYLLCEQTISGYLRTRGIDPDVVAVELNQRALTREETKSVLLRQGDTLQVERVMEAADR